MHTYIYSSESVYTRILIVILSEGRVRHVQKNFSFLPSLLMSFPSFSSINIYFYINIKLFQKGKRNTVL